VQYIRTLRALDVRQSLQTNMQVLIDIDIDAAL
jgi:hypothetical protein